jgi:hypothetical protein
LFLENCAGGVHDQLWQKTPVEETKEIKILIRNDFVGTAALGCPVERTRRLLRRILQTASFLARVDYLSLNGENK